MKTRSNLLSILWLTCMLAVQPALAAEGKVAVGSPAPDFTVESLSDGSKQGLSALKGQVVLVNYWATWCAPCVEELPALAKLQEKLKSEGLRVFAVNVDRSRKDAQRFLEKNRLEPLQFHWADPSSGLQTQWQAMLLPTSYIINQDGVIVAKEYGPREWDGPEIEAKLRDLLKSPVIETVPTDARCAPPADGSPLPEGCTARP